MSILFQIPNAMLNSIWMMSILFILYNALKFVSSIPPAKSFLLAVMAELTATLYFITSIFNPGINSFKIASITISTNTIWMNYAPYFGLIYCIVILVYLSYLLFEYKQLSYLKQSANFEQNNFWNQELSKVGVGNFQIGQSTTIQSPITFGWMDAVILLPFSILNHLSINEVKFILLHEVAHILRNDFMIQLMIKFCHSILLFNPFSYFFTKEINTQRELACDEWVVKQFGNPLEYTKSLYQLALVANMVESPLLLNAIGRQKDVLNRIKHIHQIPIKAKLPLKQLSLASFLFLMTSIGLNMTTHNQSKQAFNTNSKLVNKTSYIYAKVDAFQSDSKTKKMPTIVIAKLKATLPSPTPFKEEEYSAVVANAVNWIKTREDQYQMVNYSKSRDSLDFEIAEKLLLRSLLQNYQLRKELLNSKLANIESEKEALDYLENSNEWKEVLQYENWANTFLKRHPELSRVDSLRRF